MRVLRVLVVALAALRAVDTVKEALPVIPPPVAKSLLTIGVAMGLTALGEGRTWRRVVLEGLGAAGAASLMHDVQSAATAFADNHVTQVLTRTARRAGPLGAG